MQTNAIEWGADINAANGGKKLNWLSDDDLAMCHWGHEAEGEFSGPYECRHICGWGDDFIIRLPADHWAYPVIAAGFEPWGGGEDAPEDAGEVMFRNGEINPESPFYRWGHAGDGNHFDPEADIIGYKRKVAPGSEMWSAATVEYEPGDVVRIPNGETAEAIEEIRAGDLARFGTIEKLVDDLNGVVTTPTMTEEEAHDKAASYSDRWLADELKTVQDVIMAVYTDLGLIRPTTLLDQFEVHHGGLDDNQRAIIEIYQEWVAGYD